MPGLIYFDDDPLTTLKNHGIEEQDFTVNEPWDKYPTVARILSVWDATSAYVHQLVDNTFANDALVAEDKPPQDWMSEASDSDGGNIKGLPAMRSRDDLHEVLTSLI
jgi:hypothetical protein